MRTKKLILAASLIVCLLATLRAQTTQTMDAQPSGVAQARSAELEEAGKLRANAVELFSELKYSEAVVAAKRAADLYEKADGSEGAETAKAVALLAFYYDVAGQVDQAEPLYRRAISIWEKKSDSEPVDYFDALRRYAALLQRKKRNDSAEKYGRRARELGERLKVWEHESAKTEEEKAEGRLNQAAVNKPQPSSPNESRPAKIGKTVVVEILVDEDGRVVLACAKKGPRGLWDASERAAYGWRFKPTLLSGVPVRVAGTITFNFVLQ